jgi:EAL domain-containing protein (putative c-di-GMP-specific phosphodiesterase class I)/GGDEF domain-containing protein
MEPGSRTSSWSRRAGALLSLTSDLVFFTDASGAVTDANEATTTLLGWDLATRPVRATSALTLASRAMFELAVDTALRTDGRWQGELTFLTAEGGRRPVSLALHTGHDPDSGDRWIGAIGRDLSADRDRERQLRRRVTEDPETGLPNAEGFSAAVRGPLADRGGALLLCHLDDLHLVEAMAGGVVRRRVLAEVVARLTRSLPPDGIVGRLTPQRFAVFLPGQEGLEALGVARAIQRELAAPHDLDGQPLRSPVRLGLAAAPPGTIDIDLTVGEAELALGPIGQATAPVHLFDEAARSQVLERQQLRQDLHHALERGELSLHYQPIVPLDGAGMTSVEALLRWEHPQRGTVGPATFVPLLEESGAIVEVGAWVLREAVAQLARWDAQAAEVRGLAVSVNVASAQLRAELVAEILVPLRGAGIDARRLTLELTESAMFDDLDLNDRVLGRLRATGVRVALDDFGVGFSALGSLQRLPLDVLKIDRSFVLAFARTGDISLIRNVCRLAADLELRTVAEGVEDVDLAAVLREVGCDLGQGYLWSRPVPAGEVVELAQRLRRRAVAGV